MVHASGRTASVPRRAGPQLEGLSIHLTCRAYLHVSCQCRTTKPFEARDTGPPVTVLGIYSSKPTYIPDFQSHWKRIKIWGPYLGGKNGNAFLHAPSAQTQTRSTPPPRPQFQCCMKIPSVRAGRQPTGQPSSKEETKSNTREELCPLSGNIDIGGVGAGGTP